MARELAEGLEDLFAKVAEVIDYILVQGVGGIETVVKSQPFSRSGTGKFREHKMLRQADISHTGLKNKTTKIFIRTTN